MRGGTIGSGRRTIEEEGSSGSVLEEKEKMAIGDGLKMGMVKWLQGKENRMYKVKRIPLIGLQGLITGGCAVPSWTLPFFACH